MVSARLLPADRRAARGIPVATEALVRLIDDAGQLRLPDEFISVAEDTGLIGPLGLEVLRQACAQQVKWLSDGRSESRICVNLAARQLQSNDFVAAVHNVLEWSGLPGSALCLELTETALIESNVTNKAVRDLTDLGIAIGLDDFGTGMSSLAHLRHFPISFLKIDRSFVAGLDQAGGDAEVVKAVISLGQALGLEVIAEGIETQEQAQILENLGCRRGQGYLYGRPESASTPKI